MLDDIERKEWINLVGPVSGRPPSCLSVCHSRGSFFVHRIWLARRKSWQGVANADKSTGRTINLFRHRAPACKLLTWSFCIVPSRWNASGTMKSKSEWLKAYLESSKRCKYYKFPLKPIIIRWNLKMQALEPDLRKLKALFNFVGLSHSIC